MTYCWPRGFWKLSKLLWKSNCNYAPFTSHTASYLEARSCCMAVSLVLNYYENCCQMLLANLTTQYSLNFPYFSLKNLFSKNFRRLLKHDLLCLNPYLLSLIKLWFFTTLLNVISKVIPVWQKFPALHHYVLIFSLFLS